MLRTITPHSRQLLKYNRSIHFIPAVLPAFHSTLNLPFTRLRSIYLTKSRLVSHTMDFPKPVSEPPLSTKSTSAATELSAIESAKRAAAQLAVKEHFDPEARFIGIGSGTTIVYVVEAIKELQDPRIQNIHFVPTGYQSRQVFSIVSSYFAASTQAEWRQTGDTQSRPQRFQI